ncbi:MAG: helix-hairpin-helix domain-containing protein [Ignavibacteria bacterium]|jgi:competence ComEA-like helix-hairpin-helix protein|nr:helix-hairpin-helix domain-containing protein [Ignavibacteria bacterium]
MGLNSLLNQFTDKFAITRKELYVLFILFIIILPFFINKYFIGHDYKSQSAITKESIVKTLDSVAEAEAKRNAELDSIAQTKITDTSITFAVSNRKPVFKGILNINTASKTDLMKLANIGEKTAEKIIEHRTKKPFRRIEDILYVKGIGIKTFQKIKPHITV